MKQQHLRNSIYYFLCNTSEIKQSYLQKKKHNYKHKHLNEWALQIKILNYSKGAVIQNISDY